MKFFKAAVIVLFLILTPLAFAEDFQGYKFPGDKFTLNGDNFTIQRISENWTSVIIKYNTQNILIPNNTCKDTDKNFYLICFKGAYVKFSSGLGKLDDYSGEILPSINMTFSYRRPQITATRTITKTNPLLMEEVFVDIIIENAGKNPATIKYVEYYPTDFDMTIISELIPMTNRLEHTSTLNSGGKTVLSYKLKPTKHAGGKITGNLTYSYETITETKAMPENMINTSDSVIVTPTLTSTTGIGGIGVLEMDFDNIELKSNVDINAKTIIPKDLEVTSTSSEIEKKDNVYSLKYYLEKEDSESFKIEFKTTKTGSYTIPLEYSYKIYGIEKIFYKNLTIVVTTDKIEPTITLYNEKIGSNQEFRIKASIKNLDPEIKYYDINSNIESEILNKIFNTPEIIQNMDLTLYEEEIVAPTVDNKKDIIMKLYGTYKTVNGETFNFSTSKTISVYPPKDFLILTPEVDRYVNDSDKMKINYYIENTKDTPVKELVAYETIPQSLTITEGNRNISLLSVEAKRRVQLYSYTVRKDSNASENIITTIKFVENNKEFILTQPIMLDFSKRTIQKQEIKTEVINKTIVTANTTVDNQTAKENMTSTTPTTSQTQSQNTVQEKSGWQKFIDWLKNLF